MSWHTSAIVIEGDHAAKALDILRMFGYDHLARVGVVDGDEAGSSGLEGIAAAVVDGWTFFWDPLLFMSSEPSVPEDGLWSPRVEGALLELAAASRIYAFVAEGSSDTHGFAWYSGGSRQRVRLSGEGSLLVDHGSPLVEESHLAITDEEQRLFALLEQLTGVSMESVTRASFVVYA